MMLENKVALITGGTLGIGRATALALSALEQKFCSLVSAVKKARKLPF